MEPNHNIIRPPTELPQPQEVSVSQKPETSGPVQQEARGVMSLSGVSNTSDQTVATPPTQSVYSQQTDDQSSHQRAVSSDSTGTMIADDADLIEKEWVIRAKSIVTQTKDDPHLQNNEMNKVKADYMKKRYNKDLKVSEG